VLVHTVVEQGSLSGAARRLGLSQPALSRQLAAAERRVGTVLFARQARRLQLAPGGRRLLALAQTVLPLLAEAQGELGRPPSLPPEGDLIRIGVATPGAYGWLLPALRQHADKHEFSPFRLEILSQPNVAELLGTGQAEVVVGVGPATRPELKAVTLFREEMFAYLSLKHPAARQAFLPLPDLASVDLLLEAPLREQPALAHLLGLQGIRPKRVLCVPATDALLELALHGYGIACLFRRAVLFRPQKSQLTELRLTSRGLSATWRALILKSRANVLGPKLQELAAVCAP